jgi:murein DD-endopeptidase MepM/ murein hydrolase activator NlpD
LLVGSVVCFWLVGFSPKPDTQVIKANGWDVAKNDIPSIYPVEPGKTTVESNFGYRMDPITNTKKFHTGIDLRAEEGNRVMSTANGTVLESGSDSIRGIFIIIQHGDEYNTVYNHLNKSLVNLGEVVEKGQTIGYVGSTGLSTAPHLHYEVLKNGSAVDPAGYLPKTK